MAEQRFREACSHSTRYGVHVQDYPRNIGSRRPHFFVLACRHERRRRRVLGLGDIDSVVGRVKRLWSRGDRLKKHAGRRKRRGGRDGGVARKPVGGCLQTRHAKSQQPRSANPARDAMRHVTGSFLSWDDSALPGFPTRPWQAMHDHHTYLPHPATTATGRLVSAVLPAAPALPGPLVPTHRGTLLWLWRSSAPQPYSPALSRHHIR